MNHKLCSFCKTRPFNVYWY